MKPIALIVEDNPQLNQIFSLALQADYEVKAFDTGEAALDCLAFAVPRLIILDLHLGGVQGEELLRYIHSQARFAQTHIFLATADEQQADLLSGQADLVLLKPVSPIQLQTLARRFL